MNRLELIKLVNKKYKSKPEHLWKRYLNYIVFRHNENKKWLLIIMDVKKSVVGLDSDDIVDIVNVKCEPEIISMLCNKKRFSRGYHMNKQHWLTIILDGSIKDKEIVNLIKE